MKIDDMYNVLVNHYKKSRMCKTKRGVQAQSIVVQSYKKKLKEIEQNSSFEDFLRNQKQIASQQEPLCFRSLPRRLKVYFPGPPTPPPKLQQIPYTYEIVPKVPFRMPKQKPGYVGDWVLNEGGFPIRGASNPRKNQSMIQSYQKIESMESKHPITNQEQKRTRFKNEVRKLAKSMKQKNLSLGEIIKNRGLVKKAHNFYNSSDFFLMCRFGDQGVQELLQANPKLAFDVDEEQMTGLHWGAREGHASICRILLQKYRANCHSKDCYGRTPLHLAVQNKHVQCIVRIFIQGGHLNALNKDHKTVRMVANNAYIKYLVQKLQEIKFVIKSQCFNNKEEQKIELENAIRSTLDQSSLYF